MNRSYKPRAPLRYNEVSSTQDIARGMIRPGRDAVGVVVTARRMTAGRGRLGRAWYTPPDANICLTTILPPVTYAQATEISLVAGVAVTEAIALALPEARPRLRFPNDIQVRGKKVGGILVETAPVHHPQGPMVLPLVGIGINILTAEMPEELTERATSLEAETGTALSLEEVEKLVLERLGARFEEWQTAGFIATVTAWNQWADPDARRSFLLEGTPTVCRVLALQSDGTVLLETEQGECLTLHAARVILSES